MINVVLIMSISMNTFVPNIASHFAIIVIISTTVTVVGLVSSLFPCDLGLLGFGVSPVPSFVIRVTIIGKSAMPASARKPVFRNCICSPQAPAPPFASLSPKP